jgi:putative ABC transport system permease protein
MKIAHFRLAIDSLRNRKIRSWLTMIGIFIGIAAVVSLIGLGEGLRSAITGQFGFLGTDILTVQASQFGLAGAPGQGAPNPLTDDLAGKISQISGVEASFNRYLETGTLEFNDIQGIGFAASIPDGEHRKTMETMLNLEIAEGRLLKDGDGRKALLGNTFSEEGEFGKPIRAGDRILLNDLKFEVVGILEKKGNFLLDSSVLVNEETLLEDFRESDDDSVNIIVVKVKDEKEIAKVQESVEKLLRKERDVKVGEEDFEVSTPQQALESLNSVLFAVQLFVTIIAVISLLVGGIGIMNTMYTSVIERTKEIGIMKSIGARNSTIFSLFFIESGLLGMVGGIIGIIIGITIAYGMAFAGRLALGSELIQAQVSFGLIIGSLLFSFVIGTFFGVLPAIQASRLQPVESLRSVQ